MLRPQPLILDPQEFDDEDTTDYPESDGQPMGETGIHVVTILDLLFVLDGFFEEQHDVLVTADLFLYYQKGNPRVRKAPDVTVVKGVPKGHRRVFKTWVEKAVPTTIFEITSKSTWKEDLITKKRLYAQLGVKEYFLFDPLREYLDEQLIGFRLNLATKRYVRLRPAADGSLESTELGLRLRPNDERLRLIDAASGELLLHASEAFQAAYDAQRRADELQWHAEKQRRHAEEQQQRADEQQQRAEEQQQRADEQQQRADEQQQRAETAEAELTKLKTSLAGKSARNRNRRP